MKCKIKGIKQICSILFIINIQLIMGHFFFIYNNYYKCFCNYAVRFQNLILVVMMFSSMTSKLFIKMLLHCVLSHWVIKQNTNKTSKVQLEEFQCIIFKVNIFQSNH